MHITDLTNKKIGKLTPIKILSKKPIRWLCVCVCGRKRIVLSARLIKKQTKTCGSISCRTIIKTTKNLTGQRFGRLLVLHETPVEKRPRNYVYWICKCDCGNIKNISAASLRHGSNSCGCLNKQLTTERNIKHGLSASSEYRSWRSMKERCYDSNNIAYKNYGGRGIVVCDRWLDKNNGFYNFINDLGMKPDKIFSLDRINVDGNYEPTNCKWSTPSEQLNNRRNSANIWVGGIKYNLTEYAKKMNISYKVLYCRYKAGWDHDKIITKPVTSKYEVPGDTFKLKKWKFNYIKKCRHVRSGDNLTFEEWRQVIKDKNYKCQYCNIQLDEKSITMDHIIPISKGGFHTKDNVVPACRYCNCSKQANDRPKKYF